MKKAVILMLFVLSIGSAMSSCVPGHRHDVRVSRRWRVRLKNRETGRRRTFFVRARTRSRAILRARNKAEVRWGNRGILLWARRR